MKNILTCAIMFVTLYSCKAQTSELFHYDIYLPEGTYYKDLNKDLDKFIGTWQYEEDDTVLTIVLQKKNHVINTLNKYYDLIIGEYKYEIDGEMIVDFLPRLQNSNVLENQHYIYGYNLLAKNDLPKCEECNSSEIRLQVSFIDPERQHIPCSLLLRYQTINGVEQLTALLIEAGSYAIESENQPTTIRIPYGEYLLIKQ